MTMPVLAAVDLEAKDPGQEIIYRANLGRAADVGLLLKRGVSPDQVDEKGVPLVALACMRKDKEGLNVLKALLEAGANVDVKDPQGQNALFYAVREENMEAIQLLLDHGISYYATDNEGNIARTLAFQKGNQAIVDMLDKFVMAQTEKVNEQYKEYNRKMQEREQLIAEQNKAAMEEAAKTQAEETARLANKVAPPTEDENFVKPMAATAEEKRSTPEFEAGMRSFSFQNCAFQYWSFCRQVKQRSDLSPEEMRVAIETHREQVMDMFKSLMTEYQLEKPYLDKISNNAMQRINDELEGTHSNTYRFEHGVCLMPDLQTRCTDIAETWTQEPVKKKKSATDMKNTAPKGTGIGKVGR